MEIKHLSTTLMQGWPDCPARTWEQYELRNHSGDSFEGPNPTRFGSIIHEVAETFHEQLMSGISLDTVTQPIELFESIWRRHKLADYEYFQLGRVMVESFLHRTLYEREGDTIGTEVLFVMDLDAEKVWVRLDATPDMIWKKVEEILRKGNVPIVSTIDRIDRVDANTLEITDYKTNVLPFSRWDIDNSVQLGVYDLAVRILYPEAENVKCTYDMVRHGKISTFYDDEQREGLKSYLRVLWDQIAQTAEPEERINRYCRWCDRRDVCNAYRRVIESDLPIILTLDSDTLEGRRDLFFESDQLKSKAKIIDNRLKEIESMFAAIYAKNGGQPIPMAGKQEAYFAPNPRYEFDIRAVYDLLKAKNALSLFKDIAKIQNTAVDRVLKGRSDLKEAMLKFKGKYMVKPSMKRRRISAAPVTEEIDEDV